MNSISLTHFSFPYNKGHNFPTIPAPKFHLYFNLMERLFSSLLRGIISHQSESSSQVLINEKKRTRNRANEDYPHGESRERVGSEDCDDRWVTVAVSIVRIVVCFLCMMVTTFIWAVIMILLLPWPYERIKQGNLYGHVTGRMLMWILGNPIKIEGMEFSKTRGIYICNHASPLDIFLVMWLTPTGTVGIAKKEIIWYPLFGQLYVLANHLRIDGSNPAAAIKSIQEVAHIIFRKGLSLIIFPEGTRSKSGRLLPFKKGFVHIALQSKLPIVPMVLTGTHLAWRKNSLHVRPAPLTVKFLPPIKTDDWVEDRVSEYIRRDST